MTTTPSTDTDQLAPLATEYADLAEQIDRLKQRQEEVKAAMRDLVPDTGSYAAGDLTVTLAPNRRFNEAKALELIPEQMREALTYQQPHVRKDVFKALMPEAYEQAQDVHADRLTVKPA